MIELISRESLLKKYDAEHKGAPGRARRLIEEEPIVEERKTGKWSIEFSPAYMGGAYCECSQCNYKFAVGAYIDPDEWDYCPKCGSTMTEGEAV